MATLIIISLLIIGLVFSLRSMRSRMHQGCCQGINQTSSIKRDKDLSDYPYHLRVKIKDMHCSSCVIRIENALIQKGYLPYVSLDKKELSLYSKKEINGDEILQDLNKLGYHQSSRIPDSSDYKEIKEDSLH